MNEDFKKLSELVSVDSTQLQKLYDLALIASLNDMKKKILTWAGLLLAVFSVLGGVAISQLIYGEAERAERAADSIEEMERTLVRDLQKISPVVRDWIAAEKNPRLWAAVNYLVADFYNIKQINAKVTLNYAVAIPGNDGLNTEDFVIHAIELRGKEEQHVGFVASINRAGGNKEWEPRVNGKQVTFELGNTPLGPIPISDLQVYSLQFRGGGFSPFYGQEWRTHHLLESGRIEVFANGIPLFSETFEGLRVEGDGNETSVSLKLKNPLIDPAGTFEEAILGAASELANTL